MARQKTSPFEDIIMLATKLPWWIDLAVALIAYFVLHAVASRTAPAPVNPGHIGDVMAKVFIRGLAALGQYIVPFAFSVGGLFSAVNAIRQRKLYDSVASRPGTAALNEINWADFERLVSEYFRRNGFQVTRQGGKGPDGGIDLVEGWS